MLQPLHMSFMENLISLNYFQTYEDKISEIKIDSRIGYNKTKTI